MPNFSANLSVLFTEHPMLDRFQVAADCGFKAVEIQFPYDQKAQDLKNAADQAEVEIVLINVPVGDLMEGGSGLASIPEKEQEFKQALELCASYAEVLQPRSINVLAGRELDKSRRSEYHRTYISNLRQSAAAFDAMGISTVFEAVNNQDVPGFFLHTLREQIQILEEVQHPNIRLQYDVYHMERMGEHVCENIFEHANIIGHIQFADVPGRAQPGTGNIDFEAVFKAIDDSIYTGWTGAEYNPSESTKDSLGWM
ncbi:MAG: hydroxypyruvate isomerase family protein [Gammaproteobacteria bacterium]